jgi:hypothetical protein
VFRRPSPTTVPLAVSVAAVLCGISSGALATAEGEVLAETPVAPERFQVVENQSGPVSYYRVVQDPAEPFIRAVYRPPLETTTLGFEVPDELRGRLKKVRWKWRAMTLPQGGDECRPGHGDSAAVVYLTFKRGLKWYSLKYVWSSVGRKGEICDRRNNLFRGQDTVILESGGPTGVWVTEEIDPADEFRKHWEGGDPTADVPDMVGIGLMSDGDQTNSVSAADYAGFTLIHSPERR